MISSCNNLTSIPSRSTIINVIHDDTVFLKLKLSEILLDQKIAITTDSWTFVANKGYDAVTAHFIDNNFQLQSILLMCKCHHGVHSAEEIKNMISSTLNSFKLEKNVVALVTDTAANMNLAG